MSKLANVGFWSSHITHHISLRASILLAMIRRIGDSPSLCSASGMNRLSWGVVMNNFVEFENPLRTAGLALSQVDLAWPLSRRRQHLPLLRCDLVSRVKFAPMISSLCEALLFDLESWLCCTNRWTRCETSKLYVRYWFNWPVASFKDYLGSLTGLDLGFETSTRLSWINYLSLSDRLAPNKL